MLSLIRKALPFLTVVILVAAIYDGWVFYGRAREARDMEKASEAKEAAEAQRTIDLLGGGQLKILSFYASPGAIRRGEHATICYGVYGAQSVRMEPPVEELHPAVAHCLEVAPATSTEYRLVAEDASGHIASQSLVVRVAP